MTPGQIPALFDGPVGVGVTDPRRPSGFLFPQEQALVQRAVPRRRAEFQAGRVAARMALAALDGPQVALPADNDRLPHWPRGFVGSLSHCDDLCLAVVSRRLRSLGVDVEPATPLEQDLYPAILLPPEEAMAARTIDPGLTAKLIFSAKEAAYKAQFPITRTLYDFHGMCIDLQPGDRFTARFRLSAGDFRPGDVLQGRFVIDSGHIVTAVTLA